MKELKEFQQALSTLGVFKYTTQKELKKRYLELSKIHHPDMHKGNQKNFIEINQAYIIVKNYMENFSFLLDEEEFYSQNPQLKLAKQFNYF